MIGIGTAMESDAELVQVSVDWALTKLNLPHLSHYDAFTTLRLRILLEDK